MNKIKLTKKEIKELASLSKIELNEKEIEKFTDEMQTIISSVETLKDFKQKTNSSFSDYEFNEIDFEELREDEVSKSMTQQEALSNAPEKENGYFKVYGDIFDGDSS